jgi:hypothetical protein
MSALVSNSYFQLFFGALVSLVGSFWANHWYHGKIEKKRATRESQRAYNKLVTRLLHTNIEDITDPLRRMPVEIADRIEDLKYAMHDVNPQFDHLAMVKQAILQSADQRKQLEEQRQQKTPAVKK